MQAILLVTVFSCLLAAAAGAGAVGEACLTGSTCTDTTSVCESGVCKIKAGATCTTGSTNCVSHSTCPASGTSLTCGCDTGYSALTSGLCTSGVAGEACKADGSCADSTLVCESSVCKIKAGATCTASSTNCVSHSTCPASGTSLTCGCDTGYSALTSGLCTSGVAGEACKADGSCADSTLVCESSVCKIKAGQTCTSGSTNCVSQSTCVTGTLKCTCGTGYTALTTGLCSGVAPQSVSSWLLTGSIITLLVTLSLP